MRRASASPSSRRTAAWSCTRSTPWPTPARARPRAGSTAPMPGKVVAFLAQVGDQVKAGQPLAVMEAMKMEHTIAAPRDGTVAELLYAVGDQVAEGGELLRLASRGCSQPPSQRLGENQGRLSASPSLASLGRRRRPCQAEARCVCAPWLWRPGVAARGLLRGARGPAVARPCGTGAPAAAARCRPSRRKPAACRGHSEGRSAPGSHPRPGRGAGAVADRYDWR